MKRLGEQGLIFAIVKMQHQVSLLSMTTDARVLHQIQLS